MKMTMEKFLQTHFGCKKPFRKYAKQIENEFGEKEWVFLTESGMNAYSEFVRMLYDLADLCESLQITGFVVPDEVNAAIDEFDEYVSTEHY